MGNRILKQSICTSDTIAQLSWFEEVLFYRLIVNVDDYGRFEGRPAVIRSLLFPAVDVTSKDVEKATKKLAAVGLVHCYTAKNVPYLQLRTWAEHQQIRAKKSKYPDPEAINISVDNSNASICNQLISDENKCLSNPIQYNPIRIQSNTIQNVIISQELEKEFGFDKFWELYPKKTRQEEAETAFKELLGQNVLASDLCEAASKYARINAGANIVYLKAAVNFLTGGFWREYIPKAAVTCQKCGGNGLFEVDRNMTECACVSRYGSAKGN